MRDETGLSEEEWNRMAAVFPVLGRSPGADAVRARRTLALAAFLELARRSPRPRWIGPPLRREPTLYLTIHLGSLRILRYLLRAAAAPAATVVDATHFGNQQFSRRNAWIDRRFPVDFPHTVYSGAPHRLRSALARGSLVAAVDRIHEPSSGSGERLASVPFLGGLLPLDLGILRLAGLARVPARAIFLTAPRGRLTLTAGEPLDAVDHRNAARSIGALADAAARDCPGDFDGFTHRFLAGLGSNPAGGVDFGPPF